MAPLLTATLAVAMIAWVPRPDQAPDLDKEHVPYEEFVRLSQAERQQVFARLAPENKSLLKRTHARRWLDRHRADLRAEQILLVEEAIAFLSPALYLSPGDPDLRRQEDGLRRRLQCSLGRQRILGAFTFLPPGKDPAWHERVDEWLSWFAECLDPRAADAPVRE